MVTRCEDLFKGPDETDLPASATERTGSLAFEKNVFIIMPFSGTKTSTGDQWTETYKHIFAPAIEAAGYTCSRAEVSTGNLVGSIVEELRTARIVLADITDHNPNVFYELGVRHALSKRTIVVAQRAEDIPSDLRGYWATVYGRTPGEVAEFRATLCRIIANIEGNPERSDSPVGDALHRDNVSVLAAFQRENAKKLTALFTEITGNLAALLNYSKPDELSSGILTSCLDLLLQTLYVDLGSETLRRAYESMYSLRRIVANGGLVPEDRIAKAVEDLTQLGHAVAVAREKLIRGQFSEPTTLSTLVWTSGPPRFASENLARCSSVLAPDLNREDLLAVLRKTLGSAS